jgi:hypothetical protein
MAAVDSSSEEDRHCNEEDRHANMVITTTRAMMAPADIIRILEGSVSQRLFGRDCASCVKAFVCVIFFIDRSPLLIRRAKIERAALRRNFSLGRTVTIVAERLLANFFASCKIREIRQQAARSNYFDRILRRARSEIGAECRYHAMSGHRILPR